jgi:ribosomal protein L28
MPSLPSFAAALSQPFKRSQLGLFHGKMKQFGNNVPFSKKKTRRTWLPNIQTKRLFSDALGEKVRVKLTTRALKTIRKVCKLFLFLKKLCLIHESHISLLHIVWWCRPVCSQHKVGLARLGGHASTYRSERSVGTKSIRGNFLPNWSAPAW